MNSTDELRDQHKALFAHLVIMLTTSAMQQMGKLKDPISGEIEINLDAAQLTIDMLEMLQAKTAGHLDDDEQRLLNESLSTLRLNFWETAQTLASQPSETPQQPQASSAEKTEPPEEKKPRFQKKYG